MVAEIFRDRRKPSRFSGGGGSRRVFRDRRKPRGFSGGGGGSSRNCSASTISQPRSVGRGV